LKTVGMLEKQILKISTGLELVHKGKN